MGLSLSIKMNRERLPTSGALQVDPAAEWVVPCAEKPEFGWWPLSMPPAFCT